MGVNIRFRPQYPYTPFYKCGLTRYTFMDRTFESGDINSLDYHEVGLINPNTCGYKICPYGEEEYCYKPLRAQQTYERKDLYANALISNSRAGMLEHYFRFGHMGDPEPLTTNTPESVCWGYLRVNYMIVKDPWLGIVSACIRFGPKIPYDNPPPGNPCSY